MLLGIWDVSKEALAAGDLRGMINLTYLTTFMQVSGILFIGMLPKFKEDLEILKKDSMKSNVGGAIFLAITFASILYSIWVGVRNILFPGWVGES